MHRTGGQHVALAMVVGAAMAAAEPAVVRVVHTTSAASESAASEVVVNAPTLAHALGERARVRGTAGETPMMLAGSHRTDPRAHSFYFTRVAYSSGGGWWNRGRAWRTDFPKADRQFLVVLRRVLGIDAYPAEHPILLENPEIRRFPFLYAVEVGYMDLTEPEARNLREYLLAGGFLVIDDFWGSVQWANFERNIQRVLPGYEIVDLPMDHPIFTTFYRIEEILQVPSINNFLGTGQTSEQDGYEPYVKGIFDDRGRLMVVINWNTDLGDAWEWAEQPDYPLKYSTFAYQMGVNFIVYAMSH